MLTQSEILIRLIIAAVFGGLIGLERERHDQPAGLRTHLILILGATIAMCISINLSMQFRTVASNGDPERMAAQVISGIGFLGAGAIFRYGAGIKGLTTAASLWTTAIIGLAVGAGYYVIGVATTLCVLFALIALDFIEKRYLHNRTTRTVSLQGLDRPGFIEEVKSVLTTFGISIKSINLTKDIRTNTIKVESTAKIFYDQDLNIIFKALSEINGISSLQIH
ncbi:MAG: MgtC/SapB family protein [Fibrobacteres bacterium]|nr:MgtC/SapB family protein [Fibrobacterota bacterium]